MRAPPSGDALTLGITGERTASGTSPAQRRWRLRLFLTTVGACVAGYLAYVIAFGVNVVFWDDWALETFLLPGQPTLGSLWAQHNEHRTFFPDLIAIAIIHLSQWNSLAFMLFSALLLVATLGVLLRVFWEEIRKAPLVWLPLPFLALTVVQYQNTLWAFQFAWFLVLFAVISALALLGSDRTTTTRLVVAAIAGVLASYSLFQGLLVWPAGMVILLGKGKPNRLRAIWCAIGVVVSIGYFADFSWAGAGSAGLTYVLGHMPEVVQGVLIAAGSVIPNTKFGGDAIASLIVTEVTGAVLLAAGFAVGATWVIRGRRPGPEAICVGLIVVSILFDLSLIPSRLAEDKYAGTVSRYDTFMWPLLAGSYCYVVVCRSRARLAWRRWRGSLHFVLSLAVIAEVVIGTTVGIEQGRVTREVRVTAADVLANLKTAPAALAAPYLLPPCANYIVVCAELRAAANVLEQDRLSIFSDPRQVGRLRRMGFLPGGVPARTLAIPPSLRGRVEASVSAQNAWRVLSAVYWASPSLQAAYAQTANGTTGLLEWAIASADAVTGQAIIDAEWSPPVPAGFFLVQYEAVYRSWVMSGAS